MSERPECSIHMIPRDCNIRLWAVPHSGDKHHILMSLIPHSLGAGSANVKPWQRAIEDWDTIAKIGNWPDNHHADIQEGSNRWRRNPLTGIWDSLPV